MIIGHKDIIDKLNRLISNNEVAHSYIFSGQDGIGKLLVAKGFAKNILCKDNEKEQIMFDNNNHPDFKLLIPDEKGTIKIEVIREMIKDISIKPIVSKYKVYIIDSADSITVQAQNALLKTLEEPPTYVVIILVTSKYNALLNTIRSRSQKLDFQRLQKNDIMKYIETNNYIVSLPIDTLISLADGSIGKFMQVIDNIEIIQYLINFVDAIFQKNVLDFNQFAIYLTDKKENIFNILDYLEIIIFEKNKEIDVASYIMYIEEAKKNIQSNINFEICIDKMVLGFEEVQNE